MNNKMIIVTAYKDGKAVRHESCYDLFTADAFAEELKECELYDEIHIDEDTTNGTN